MVWRGKARAQGSAARGPDIQSAWQLFLRRTKRPQAVRHMHASTVEHQLGKYPRKFIFS
jgi:hypothetical protein